MFKGCLMVMVWACAFHAMQWVVSCSFPGKQTNHLAVAAAVSLGLLGRVDRSGGGQAWWQRTQRTTGLSALPK